MINVEYVPWLLNVFDISALAKTADTLLEYVLKEIKYITEELHVVLVAWCTDASGESWKMRRLLRERLGWIITVDCWSHQINLIVGDYFKVKTGLIKVMDQALEVVKWFNNHGRPLGMLREAQKAHYGSILALILPALTRWTSHYLAVTRLLDLEEAIRILVLTSRARLVQAVGDKADAIRKAEEIMDILSQPHFWDCLKTIKKHLEPLAIAANITQANNARLDVVLLTLGHLYMVFSDVHLAIEPVLRQKVLDSLERRWAKIDQDVFLMAVVLNPYVRLDRFNRQNRNLTEAALWNVFRRVYVRMINEEPNHELSDTFTKYVHWIGEWSDTAMALQDISARAARDHHVVVHAIGRVFRGNKDDKNR
ncbi:hypothetical protein QCA50_007229 [Cerrena zonata]|uniref:DUF659 domain-containing protein n=1 Tax=Cerrena zonata TaxID=2478898 RepID=A0AAW0GAK3_9APHY